ncbi:MAG: hypothetical protein EOO09_16735 [Chitinophagaceae bacterium]|nr:MAG: hypothetical protein EOO09_16735 [Chitinophagaceae bacterium]
MIKLFTILFLIANLGWSCSKPGCLGKAGPSQTLTRELGAFSSIRLEGNVNLVLVQDNGSAAAITGPVNIIENISTTIVDGQLLIGNETSCRWARDPGEEVTVRLSFTSLDFLDYAGSGSVTNVDTLRLDNLKIESYTGAGDVELTVDNRYTGVFVHLENAGVTMHGRSVQCNTYTNSRGLTDLRDLEVEHLFIEYGGLADTYVNVTGTLDAILYYKGNVYYRGNPVITRDQHYSTGRLIGRP